MISSWKMLKKIKNFLIYLCMLAGLMLSLKSMRKYSMNRVNRENNLVNLYEKMKCFYLAK